MATTLYKYTYPNKNTVDKGVKYFDGAGKGITYVFKCLSEYIY